MAAYESDNYLINNNPLYRTWGSFRYSGKGWPFTGSSSVRMELLVNDPFDSLSGPCSDLKLTALIFTNLEFICQIFDPSFELYS